MNPGILSAAGAFLCWGLFPLYFHAIAEVPPLEILANRMLWSLLFLCGVLTWRRQWSWLGQVLRQPRVTRGFIASALLLSGNWFVYIWAVNNGHLIEASLGYFINPLFNVMLGFLLLHERLRRLQWAAIALAATGVAWLTWQTGVFPWVSLVLASSFSCYGLLRKTATLGPLEGLSFETLILFPLAFAYLLWLSLHGQNTFFTSAHDSTRWLLMVSGPLTALPLLMFANGARRLPLSVLGLLQYISPTLQLLIGIWIAHETFGQQTMWGFVVIWSALIIYAAEGLWRSRRT